MAYICTPIADSISANTGIRLTTVRAMVPRMIHPELLTHHDLSKSAGSSRATPVQRMLDDIRNRPALPVYWGSTQKGMQAGEELTGQHLVDAQAIWDQARLSMLDHAEKLLAVGLHKQLANRILEPWAFIPVVLTATNWNNFFALRLHKDAQPEMREVARAIKEVMDSSTPQILEPGQWHLPFVRPEDIENIKDRITGHGMLRVAPTECQINAMGRKVSAARCARTSYQTFEGKLSSIEEDLSLYDRLVRAELVHASPTEHQATPDTMSTYSRLLIDNITDKEELVSTDEEWDNPHLHGNLRGWKQARKLVPNEYVPG